MDNRYKNITRWIGFSLLAVWGIAVVLGVFYNWNEAKARNSQDSGDQVVTQTEREDNYQAFLKVATSVPSSLVLINLRGTSTPQYPHYRDSGNIRISQLRACFSVNGGEGAASTASTSMAIGVIASTSPSGALADVFYFARFDFSTVDGLNQCRILTYSPSVLKVKVSSSLPTDFASNDKLKSTNLFATSTILSSAALSGTSTPNVGDVVVRIEKQSNTSTTTIDANYYVSRY